MRKRFNSIWESELWKVYFWRGFVFTQQMLMGNSQLYFGNLLCICKYILCLCVFVMLLSLQLDRVTVDVLKITLMGFPGFYFHSQLHSICELCSRKCNEAFRGIVIDWWLLYRIVCVYSCEWSLHGMVFNCQDPFNKKYIFAFNVVWFESFCKAKRVLRTGLASIWHLFLLFENESC